jgi:methanogenic corrinoid protein MtbC1
MSVSSLDPAEIAALAFQKMVARKRSANAQLRSAITVFVNALVLGEPRLLAEHVRWSGSFAAARGDAGQSAPALFRRLHAIAATLADPGDRTVVGDFLTQAEAADDGPCETQLNPTARRYLELLLAFEQEGAQQLADEAISAGMSLQTFYLDVLEPALIEIGRLWEDALGNIAQEHYITGVTYRIMSVLAERAPRPAQRERTFVGLCVEGERHEIGLCMVRDQLHVRGWKTIYLGSDVPLETLASVLRANAPAVLGLSVAMPEHLGRARDAIATIRRLHPHVRIVVGGRPFRGGGNLWSKVGADAGPRNAWEAVSAIEALAQA